MREQSAFNWHQILGICWFRVFQSTLNCSYREDGSNIVNWHKWVIGVSSRFAWDDSMIWLTCEWPLCMVIDNGLWIDDAWWGWYGLIPCFTTVSPMWKLVWYQVGEGALMVDSVDSRCIYGLLWWVVWLENKEFLHLGISFRIILLYPRLCSQSS